MKPRSWLWLLVVVGILAAVFIAVFLLLRNIPPIEKQLDQTRPILSIAIAEPHHRQQVLAGQPITIFISTSGAEPVQNLVVTVNGEPIQQTSATGTSLYVFHWSPPIPGWYVLSAQAQDLQKRTISASPIWVEGVVPTPAGSNSPNPIIPSSILDIPLDTDNFDEQLDSRVDAIISESAEQLTSTSPGESTNTPAANPPIAAPEGVMLPGLKQAPAFLPLKVWLASLAPTSSAAPTPPQLAGKVDGCSIHLSVNDTSTTETGFLVYRTDVANPTWTVIATLSAHSGTGWASFTDSARPNGQVAYQVAAFNASGKSPSNVVTLTINNTACSDNSPVGITLQNAILSPTFPIDRLYCYASANNLDWSRIPSTISSFIPPTNGSFDLSPHLPTLPRTSSLHNLSLECWGWQGSVLIPLGRSMTSLAESVIESKAERFKFTASTIFEPIPPGQIAYKPLNLAPPYNLHYADSLAGCKAYTGKDSYLEWACDNLIDQWGKPLSGHNILVWHWYIHDNCNAQENYCGYNVPKSDITGYRVYRQTGNNEPILIRNVERNDILMAVLTPGETTSASANTRYFVRAVTTDGWESGDSNSLQAEPAPFHMTLPALVSQEMGVRVYKPGGKIVGVVVGGEMVEQSETPALVGYFRHHSPHLPRVTSIYFHEFLYFDLSQVKGTISSATLMWDGKIHTSGPGNDLFDVRCNNYVTDYMGTQVGYSPIMMLSMWADVTNLINIWKQNPMTTVPGDPYSAPYGFWLYSGDTSLASTEYDLDLCTVDIKNIRLEIEYYK